MHSFVMVLSKSILEIRAIELNLIPGFRILHRLLNKTLGFSASVTSIQKLLWELNVVMHMTTAGKCCCRALKVSSIYTQWFLYTIYIWCLFVVSNYVLDHRWGVPYNMLRVTLLGLLCSDWLTIFLVKERGKEGRKEGKEGRCNHDMIKEFKITEMSSNHGYGLSLLYLCRVWWWFFRTNGLYSTLYKTLTQIVLPSRVLWKASCFYLQEDNHKTVLSYWACVVS